MILKLQQEIIYLNYKRGRRKMIREIQKDIYQIEVVLPNNPLKILNAYLIKGKDRNLLIDTGFAKKESYESLLRGLDKLNIDMKKTDVFLTHLHNDHISLVKYIIEDNCKVYMHPLDQKALRLLNDKAVWKSDEQFNEKMGFPKGRIGEALSSFRDLKEIEKQPKEFIYEDIFEDDIIKVGEYEFKCILTPGHTPGHCCLYEENNKILIGGDLILDKITPNISLNNKQWLGNPLEAYIDSLNKVKKLQIDIILPSHRNCINGAKSRIEELKEHSYKRLEEVMRALQAKHISCPYDLAGCMNWNIRARSWEEFPLTQKFFALGETMANLVYLESKGLVERDIIQGKIYFSISTIGLSVLSNKA